MKYLKRFFVLQLLLLFIIPIIFAEINIMLPEDGIYNLGDKIFPSVSIKEDNAYDGFFNLNIFCDNYNLQYYTTPLSLEAGLRTQLTVPELPLSKSMLGKCRLKSNFGTGDGETIDSVWSEYFFVTDNLNITISGNLEAKPGGDITLLGETRKSSNEALQKGEAEISFRGKETKVDIASGKFEHTIHLEDGLEAGDIPVLVVVRDKYDNYGNQALNIKVLPIPTKIENIFEDNIIMPGDALKVRIILYDHSNRVINGSKVNVKLFGPDDKLVAEKDIQSLNYLEFNTEKRQMPGNYYLLSTFEDIKKQDSFIVETVRKIVMRQENSLVYIENVGNVDYNDETTIILESNGEKYLINKKINLEPGEEITIDLSKEVPKGTYDIILPAETADTEIISEEITQDAEQQNVIKDVLIEDNRNIIKKLTEGLSSITGAVVVAAGYVASRPLLASTILVLIILGTVTHYSWGFIKSKIKKKKDDDTSHLFDDFKFEGDKKNEDSGPGD